MTHHKKVLGEAFKAWLPLAAAIVLISGLVYFAVQQNYRSNANDPQIQISEDVAFAIGQGTPANSIVPATGTTDMAQSLSVFVLIYDDAGKQIGSSALLDGKNPEFPTGVFDDVKKNGQQTVTWEPKKGVRAAAVVSRYSGEESGYVVAGRSLREVDKRITNLCIITAAGLGFTLLITFLLMWLMVKMGLGHHKHEHTEIILDTTK